jgi:hypothetical protein
VSVRLSAERLWLPVRQPVHFITIGLYETPTLPGRARYLPALLALGALAAAFAYFAVSAVQSARRERQALLLAAVAGAGMLQLGAEVSRTFVDYAYPWHLGRLVAIAVMAAVTALLIGAYGSERFIRERRGRILALTAIASLASLLLVPSFDLKAIGALFAGFVALGLCGLAGLKRGVPGAGWAMAGSVAAVLLIALDPAAFLDRNHHLLMAAMLVSLVVTQVGALRSARGRLSQLETRLREAEEAGEPIVSLRQGDARLQGRAIRHRLRPRGRRLLRSAVEGRARHPRDHDAGRSSRACAERPGARAQELCREPGRSHGRAAAPERRTPAQPERWVHRAGGAQLREGERLRLKESLHLAGRPSHGYYGG